jgi:hypothetical protein
MNVPEQVSLMDVLGFQFSNLFERYYSGIIARSGFVIEFHLHEGLPELNDEAAYSRFNEGIIHVYLSSNLTEGQAEVLAAHEITEPVLNRVEMYPNLYVASIGYLQKDWYGGLAIKISSAVLNAVVNRRLKEYGFDIGKLKEATLVRLLRRLPLLPPIINSEEEITVNALTYLDHYLSYAPSIEMDRLTEYFMNIGGDQWELIQSLVAISEETGFEDIDQSLACMTAIRDHLELKPYLLVRDRRNDSLQ